MTARLPIAEIAAFLAANGVTVAQVEEGKPYWRLADGTLAAPTKEGIEELIASQDVPSFATLHLRELSDLRGDRNEIVIPQGAPWTMQKRQLEFARVKGDLLIDGAAGCGKTRLFAATALHHVHYKNSPVLIGVNSKRQALRFFTLIDDLIRESPIAIGGGLREEGGTVRGQPDYLFNFNRGGKIAIVLAGQIGDAFRGEHVDLAIGDEASAWKSRQAFDQFFARVRTGRGRILMGSTPDGRFSSAWYRLLSEAVPVDPQAYDYASPDIVGEEIPLADRQFQKIRVQLPEMSYPIWSEKVKAALIKRYGSESSTGYALYVLAAWTTGESAVWSASTLQACLTRDLPDFRLIVARANREAGTVSIKVATTNEREKGLLEDVVAPIESLAREIAGNAHFYDPKGHYIAGVDLGSAQDPTELSVVRDRSTSLSDIRLEDVLRVHLEKVEYPLQQKIFLQLEHEMFGHGGNVSWFVDEGDAGQAVCQALLNDPAYQRCPECSEWVYLNGRLTPVRFGAAIDETDLAGNVLTDPRSLDKDGNPRPFRNSIKECSTRWLSSLFNEKRWRLGDDGGAENDSLSKLHLLSDVRSEGVNMRGARRFSGSDHLADSLRLIAYGRVKGPGGDLRIGDPGVEIRSSGRRVAPALFERHPPLPSDATLPGPQETVTSPREDQRRDGGDTGIGGGKFARGSVRAGLIDF